MREETLRAALAGLLHDIGKFAQRAGEGTTRIWDGEAEREYKYRDFVARFVPGRWRAELSGPARHHRPQSHQDRIVALADRLSAGERSDSDGPGPKRLLSIFCRVQAGECAPPAKRYLPLRVLAMDKQVLFPTHEDEDDDSHRAYKTLWDGFACDAQKLCRAHSGPEADLETYLAGLLMLMQRYTWCIPSAYYKTLPDVSLYDHSRMTAAIAACLVDWDGAAIEAALAGRTQVAPVALLVGGDVSGIQNFIYTLSSQGATSALRGRSFYLQLLTEAVFCFVLRRLALPLTNLIYGGGGHFYLLATPEAAQKLPEIQRHVSHTLLRHHGGDLYLALAQTALHAGDFKGEAFKKRWQSVAQALRRAKARRFSELGDEMHPLVFEPWRDQGNQEQECQVCGREHAGTKERDGTRKCPPCLSLEDLGEKLRHAPVLRLDEIPIAAGDEGKSKAAGSWSEVLADLGLAASLSETEKPAPGARRSVLLALQDDVLEQLSPGPRVAIGRRFLVNVTPEKANRIKTFREMAQDAQGIKRLGVLRMDVDDLGKIFSQGLGHGATLSRVAALSFAMSLFFEGWVEALAQKYNPSGKPLADRVYSIYSGGDDLFFVGSWDAMPGLALDIRNDFARFAADHPGLHLSAGVALAGAKYPLYQAAEDARVAERRAKDYSGKNAIAFLGQTIDWDTFARVAEWAREMCLMLQKKGVPKSLLRTLTLLQQQRDTVAQKRAAEGLDRTPPNKPQPCYGPWLPHAAYALSRMQKRHSSARDELQALKETLRPENPAAISWIGLAARWADLLER